MPSVHVPERFNAAAFFLDRHVLRQGAVGDDDLRAALREGVKKRLAGYKAPRWIEFVGDLPKTATGNVQRYRLRDAP